MILKICKMKSELRNINRGEIVYHKKMTTTSWHLKIRTIFPMELDIDKNPGYVIPVMIGYNNQGIPVLRRFMLWSYDAMRNIADITIHPSPDKELYNWLGDLQNGKIIKWMNPEEMMLQESNTECYYLIGNADAQSFFYQFNRNLPFSSTVNSFIYSRHTGEFFPDVDGSYPLNYHIVYPYSPERVLDLFRSDFIRTSRDFRIILAGSDEVNKLFTNFFKKEWATTEDQVRIVNFNNPY
ncbi:siderophore-interacting protein [Elizabethkingia ursingii]|uniref:Siderophore-interacting protein n=2 Tax=Elizabethkingia ursingii TaxID=1756150 RepID=A0AAJ3NAT1_9FLAO|nr:siderophore-interacting protein [Elizabethkingia ursingii]KUY30491.1 siderophore-interacting protein [Elizabethkingia ursingii]OPB73686.1 siderophore-interacting protein [Elizabethkingia ursingii]OPB88714.1 siderophore-interacting protein [Elizabethkingia ursingii]